MLTAFRRLDIGIKSLRWSSIRRITTSPMPEIANMITKNEKPIKTHEDLYEFSLRHPARFWATLAKSRLSWYKEFDNVIDCDMKNGRFNWFSGGLLNVTVNCVDRHAEKHPNRVALIWEKDEPGQEERITYRQLLHMTNQVANVLQKHGVRMGDPVAIYMPTSPIAVATILACARIGAIHSVIFAGFSAEAIAMRVNDANAKILVTCDQAVRAGKTINLKQTVDDAVAQCPNLQTVLVARRTGEDVPMGPKDRSLQEEMLDVSTTYTPAKMAANDHLFMLYTSGSTGKPKGLLHSQAGYLLYAAVSHRHVFDFREGDIFGCVADIGWITGHSYVIYGPLCNGGTTLLFESTPVYPDPGRYWETVQRLKLTHFYGAPTAIRLLIKHGDSWVKKYDRSSLRVLASVGEPLNLEAWNWFYSVVGEEKRDLIDTWWQTETGGVALAPRPSAPGAKIVGGKPMRPMFGIDPALVNRQGKIVTGNDVKGALCIRQPWPGLAQTIYGDHKRFVDTYFKDYPGVYLTGDGAMRDNEGFYQITGRIDDVINVTGHRLDTAEVEAALNRHPNVAESAVVGFPHEITGEGVYAFVVLKDVADKIESPEILKKELRNHVRNSIASYAAPELIQICAALPKTRSGKILRRVLKRVASGKTDDFGDITTLAEPEVINDIVVNSCLRAKIKI
uniref:Acetyl-coenzyme A synthetase n=1 Tax=Strigamia maritima TaxID=126957 RepID=T1JJS3_STRMM